MYDVGVMVASMPTGTRSQRQCKYVRPVGVGSGTSVTPIKLRTSIFSIHRLIVDVDRGVVYYLNHRLCLCDDHFQSSSPTFIG